jgi:CO/xanthine dehydrogenase FAD-binding subunit
MLAFTLAQPASLDAALAGAGAQGTKYIAGGTDLLQLMTDNVEAPTHLIDLEPLPADRDSRGQHWIAAGGDGADERRGGASGCT